MIAESNSGAAAARWVSGALVDSSEPIVFKERYKT